MRRVRRIAIAVVVVVLLHGTSALAVTTGTTTGIDSTFGSMVVDDANQHVFVSSPGTNAVQVFDFTGKLVSTIPNLAGAYGMVVHGSTLYVAESTAGTIEEINLTTLADEGPLTTGVNNPQWLVFAGGALWTTEYRESLASISLSGAVTHFYTTDYHSPDLATSPATPNVLYVAEDGPTPGAIHELDVSSGSPVATVQNTATDQGGIAQLAVSPDGTRVVPAAATPNEIEELAASTLAADGVEYPGSESSSAVAVSPGEGGLLATGFAGGESIGVYTLGNTSPLLTASNQGNFGYLGTYALLPHGLALSSDATRMFAVTTQGIINGLVLWTYYLDGSTATSTTVSVSPGSGSVGAGQPVTLTATVSPAPADGTVAFYANGTLTAINGCGAVPVTHGAATCIISSLPTGSDAISAQYTGDAVYAGSSGSASIFVISTATSVDVAVSPQSIIADGSATTTVTATLHDASGNVVFGDGVGVRTVPANALTLVSAGGSGTSSYTWTFTAPTNATTPTSVKITVTDPDTQPSISGTANLTLQPAPSFTWAGAASAVQWSASGNWVGGTAPTGTVGMVSFPGLTSRACSASPPTAACYSATNDVPSLSASGLDVAGCDSYTLTGQGITLRGAGLTVAAPAGSGTPPAIDLPLTLGLPQSWTIDAGPVLLGGPVTGSQPLTVNFNSGSVEPSGGMEVGAIWGNYIGGFYLDGGASLNATDGNEVDVSNGAGVEADQTGNTIGPVAVQPDGWLSVGGADAGGGQLAVNGDLTFATFDPHMNISGGQELDLAVDAPGTSPGVDYSQLTATGNIALNNTELNMSQRADAAGSCVDLRPGDVLTLLRSSGGTISGTFDNYAPGASVDIADTCNGADQDASGTISYSSTAVTLTIANAGDAGDVPVELDPPSLSGTSQEGQTLELQPGSWQGATSLEYSWWQCRFSTCSQISGAASPAFIPTSAQLGYQVVGAVAADGPSGSNTAFTGPSSAVTAEPVPVSTVPPAITGGTTVGDLLTASPGTWSNSPTSYTYQWERCYPGASSCQTIIGANTGSYALTNTDAGSAIEVYVDAANYGGYGSTVGSTPTAVISFATVTTTTPTRTITTPTVTTPTTPTTTQTLPVTPASPGPKVSAALIKSALKLILEPTGSAATAKQVVKLGGYRFSFSAPSRGQLTVTWTAVVNHRTVTLGRANVSVSAAHTIKFRVALTVQGKRVLERSHGLKIKAVVSFKAVGQNRISESGTFELAGPGIAPQKLDVLIATRRHGVSSKLGLSPVAHR